MASLKKFNGSTWVDSKLRKYGTDTDTLTTLPADIYPNAATATVGLKGQTVQSSVPSPTSPVMPQGCGDLETVGTKAGQYKIPISSANTTTPIYLGEAETERKIGKLVLTSTTVDWTYDSTYNRYVFRIADSLILGVRLTPVICSHFTPISDGRPLSDVPNNSIYSNAQQAVNNWFIKTEDYTTAASFKQFLDDELAAGTPVTVWYVLAEPETGIVNEPLMKIGDYADSISGITIPTITGKDTFDVETTLKPSEVSLSYTGWHDASVKEWDGSQWQ